MVDAGRNPFDHGRMALIDVPKRDAEGHIVGKHTHPPYIVLTTEAVLRESPELRHFRIGQSPDFAVWADHHLDTSGPATVYVSFPDEETFLRLAGDPRLSAATVDVQSPAADGSYLDMARRVASLNSGQVECLRLVHQNFTTKEIAAELRISPHTVDQRIRQSLQILGVERRTQAARLVAGYARFEEDDILRPEFVEAVFDALNDGDYESARLLVAPLHPADIADLMELAARDERESLVRALAGVINPQVLTSMREFIGSDLLDPEPQQALDPVETQKASKPTERTTSIRNTVTRFRAVDVISSASWVGNRSLREQVSIVDSLAPLTRNSVDQLVTAIEAKRLNDPAVQDALSALKELHNLLGELIERAEANRPMKRAWKNFEHAKEKLADALWNGAQVVLVAPALAMGTATFLSILSGFPISEGMVTALCAASMTKDALLTVAKRR